MTSLEVEIEGRRLALSNLEKVLYPAAGFTKGQVIDYYVRVAPYLLPHLRSRPLTLKRYPDGVDGEFFYEKNCPAHRPPWMQTAAVPSGGGGRTIAYCLVNELAALVWVANLASLELHPSLGSAPHLSHSDSVVFDLDPGEGADAVDCCRVALLVKETLDQLSLVSVVKSSGSKGLQVYVPLNSGTSYERTRGFAHALARLLERDHPALVVSNMRKDLRRGKVLIDWSQNHEAKTTIGVYSLRARERPTVSAPLTWDEVARAAERADAQSVLFEAGQVLERAERHGDLFAPLVELSQQLP